MTTKTKVTIYVGRDGSADSLYLRDSEGHVGKNTITTDVQAGDEVEWVLGEGVDEITNIYPKSGSQNIFSDGPIKQEDGSWKGKVKDTVTGSESYSIDYTIAGSAFSDDPKLDVKPPRDK